MALQTLATQTTSSIRCYRKCPRLYKYLYLDLVRPARTPIPFLVGTVFHYACELFWHGARQEEIIEGLETLFATESYWATDKGKFQAAKVKAMAWAYYNRWASNRGKYDVVAVEKKVEFKLTKDQVFGDPPALSPDVYIVGKFDALLKERKTDKYWLVETKTADFDVSEVGHPYWERLAVDLQVTVYSHPLRDVYGDIGIIFDVSRKPRHRPKTSKGLTVESSDQFYKRVRKEMSDSLDKYFVRQEVHRTRKQNEAILDEARCTVVQMASAKQFPRNDWACIRGSQACEFLGCCVGTDRTDSGNFVKVETPHPELSK